MGRRLNFFGIQENFRFVLLDETFPLLSGKIPAGEVWSEKVNVVHDSKLTDFSKHAFVHKFCVEQNAVQ